MKFEKFERFMEKSWTAINVVYSLVGIPIMLFVVLSIYFPTYFLGFLSIAFEDLLIKNEVKDNIYVADKYRGWKELTVYGQDAFLVPGEWVFEDMGEYCQITDESGSVTGYAVCMSRNEIPNQAKAIDEFTERIFGCAVKDVDTEFDGYGYFEDDYFEMILEDANKTFVQFLTLERRENEDVIRLYIAIPSSDLASYEQNAEILEAIHYSYNRSS